jgi:hypothetical protein
VRGAFSVSPKSLTVNTITPGINGQTRGHMAAEHAAQPHLRGPEGVEIILNAAAWHDNPFLATTRQFPPPAGADGISAVPLTA